MENFTIKGNHPVMEKILSISQRVASTDSTVLVWSPKAITNAHKLPAPPKGIAIGG